MSKTITRMCAYARAFIGFTCIAWVSACGDATDKAQEWTEDTAEATQDAAEAVKGEGKSTLDSVRTTGSDFGRMMTQAADDMQNLASEGVSSVGDWIDGPALAQRRQKCLQEKGDFVEVVEVGACIDGSCTVTVDGDRQTQTCVGDAPGERFEYQCVHKTWTGTYYFNDGPSVPHLMQRMGEVSNATNFVLWNSLFWEAAVNHDYCYHHGNATYGYGQEACDTQFVDDLMAVCLSSPESEADWFDEDTCVHNAHGMYGAVRGFGGSNFNSMNTKVSYPKYKPMYEKLGLKEQPVDERLRGIIDGAL